MEIIFTATFADVMSCLLKSFFGLGLSRESKELENSLRSKYEDVVDKIYEDTVTTLRKRLSIFPFRSGTTQLFYRKVGTGPNVVIVIHGMVSSSQFWFDGFVKYLQEKDLQHFTFIIPDMAGYGHSLLVPRSDFDVDEQIHYLERDVLNKEAVEFFHVVGHSYGGLIALKLAGKNAERVSSLTLLAPCYFRNESDFAKYLEDSNAALIIKFIGRLNMSPYLLRGINYAQDFLLGLASFLCPTNVIPSGVWTDMFTTRSYTTISTILGIQRNLTPFLGSKDHLFESLLANNAQIFLIHGDEDWVIPISQSEKLWRDYPESIAFFPLRGVGHHFPLTAAPRFTDQLLRLLRSVQSSEF